MIPLDHAAKLRLVGCVSTKGLLPARARDMYQSALFSKRRRHAEATGDPWFILSAKYGLLHPDAWIEPYEQTLDGLSPDSLTAWQARVVVGIAAAARLCRADRIELHAGADYVTSEMEEELARRGCHLNRPLAGLKIGEQLAWYDRAHAGAVAPPVSRHTAITTALLAYNERIPHAEVLFPAVDEEARLFASQDPFAFCVGTVLDRGTRAEVIWHIPMDLRNALGHLDPARVAAMGEPELMAVFKELPHKPRYWTAAPRTVLELARLVVGEFDGDPAGIWRGRSAGEVRRTFRRIHGVGPALANMAVLLIEQSFGVMFEDVDRPSIDIKPDVHTARVLHRLGVAPEETPDAAVEAARLLHPAYPGALDAPLWVIGRTWCKASSPRCDECEVRKCCGYAIWQARAV
ncbi:MAG: hypothetical protein KDB73_15035 [Planctomycetes bacterium]|nr:hypothetical protein [Planctomycetota bacterium]